MATFSDTQEQGEQDPGQHRIKHNWPTLAAELRLIREGIPFLTPTDVDFILGETAGEIWSLA